MIASGYSMDLYCEAKDNMHGYGDGEAHFFGETWADCARQAKRAGWKINKQKRECICPKCISQGLKIDKQDV